MKHAITWLFRRKYLGVGIISDTIRVNKLSHFTGGKVNKRALKQSCELIFHNVGFTTEIFIIALVELFFV